MTVVYEKGFAQTVEKSDGAILSGLDSLFTITGGPIMVTEFIGFVTTLIEGAATLHIEETVTTPASTLVLSSTVAVDDDAAGTSYTFTAATPGVLTPTTAGGFLVVPAMRWLCPIGTIACHGSAARVGVIKWYISYVMLSQFSKVVAAA